MLLKKLVTRNSLVIWTPKEFLVLATANLTMAPPFSLSDTTQCCMYVSETEVCDKVEYVFSQQDVLYGMLSFTDRIDSIPVSWLIWLAIALYRRHHGYVQPYSTYIQVQLMKAKNRAMNKALKTMTDILIAAGYGENTEREGRRHLLCQSKVASYG